jgi:3,4-dehydroadipyl-CoA semialdehyde dehydrogenase
LRKARGVVEHGAHLNAEADSLNASVLGPDVQSDSELAHLFLGDIVRDMTQKTGQKCTAIRRVYVPKESLGFVLEGLRERLTALKVGNPHLEEVGMGPLTTAAQLKDIRAGIEKLLSCSKLSFGVASSCEGLGAPKGKGYYQGPTVLHAENPSPTDAVHSHEVFGPNVTVMAYDGTAEDAARWVSHGQGGLVASLHSDDKVFVKSALTRLASFNGRLVLGTTKTAAQAIPPGMVLPHLLHGGPGRAGGGEELGGTRGLALYMQRCAFQGDRAFLEHTLAAPATVIA